MKERPAAVFIIQNNPSLVAKIYNKSPDQEKIDKIFAMIGMGNEKLLKLATWPINSIHGKDNKLIGFTMPKLVDHKPISNLYSPKQRLQEFPKADWRFLIHAAINTAKAFSIVHEAADVDGTRLMGISGFGRVLVSRLIDWKKACENRFAFDSKKGLSQMDVAALDRDIVAKRRAVEVELSIKISQLSLLSKETSASRKKLQDQIYEILPKYAQAIVNAKEVGIRI